jgi:signal transduction histidine kinase
MGGELTMSDYSDVQEIAETLDMNPREKARFDLHLEDIKKYQRRARFWRIINSICQIIFFWNIVALALEVAQVYATEHIPSVGPYFTTLNDVIGPISIIFWTVSAFAFFFMIWTGIIRQKWEGKLTRATAYCLSFLSNIEHREYLKLEQDFKRKKKKAKALMDPEFREKKELLQSSRDSGKISNTQYERNLRMLEELHGK